MRRKGRKLAALILTFIMCLGVMTLEAAADYTIVDGAIQGTVVDERTQEPIADAVTVTLYKADDMGTVLGTTTCDTGTGVFTLLPDSALEAGEYVLVFENSLYLRHTETIELSSGSGLALAYSIGLTPVGRTSGTVTEASAGEALSGVAVRVYLDGVLQYSTVTDSEGKYAVETAEGVYTIKFVRDGYTTQVLERESLGAIATLNNVTMTAGMSVDEDYTGGNEEIRDSGSDGDVSWVLYSDGTLIVSGTGEIPDQEFQEQSNITTVVIEKGVTAIGSSAFAGCNSLTSISIPDGVTSIGDYVFFGCSSLTSISIPDSVRSIGDSTFRRCSGLTSISIPDSVTSIGDGAFEGCSRLTRISIPDSVTSIGDYAFFGCSSLTSISIPDSVTSIGNYAFDGCSSLTSISIPDSVTSIGDGAFAGCSSLTSISIPDSVTSIGNWAFNRCSSLTSISIPDSVTSIGNYAFKYCSSLTSISIPDSVTSIGNYAFYACYNLTSITLPDSVTSIGNYAFEYCSSLTSISIPDSVTSIGDSAFTGCSGLTDVYYGGGEEEWNAISVGTGNEYLTDAAIYYHSAGPANEQYGTTTAVTDTTSLLSGYASDWNHAYTTYVEAVEDALCEFVSSSAANRDEVILSQKNAMMKADAASGNGEKYISGTFYNDEIEDAAYEALATFMYDHIYSAIDLSSISAEDINGTKLVNTVMNAIRSDSETYTIGHVTVSIATTGFGNVGFGSLTCKSTQAPGKYTYVICSGTSQCEKAIRDYLRQLVNLENSAIYQVYSSVCKDVLGQSLDKLTETYLTKKLQPYVSKINSSGIGDLMGDLNSCYNYYQYVKKMMGWTNSADTPENLLSAMQGIEFTDSSITSNAVKKAWKSLENATVSLNNAYMNYLSGTLDESEIVTWWNNTVQWWSNNVTTLKAIFTCPVNISVYDSSGRLIGYVGEDDIWYTEDLIYIEEAGDAKIIYSFTDGLLTFQMAATNYGTLGCSIEEYDEAGQPTGRTNYYDIALYPGKTLSVAGTQDDLSGNIDYIITTGGEVIEADEYITSNQAAAISVDCGVSGNGAVEGTGTYVRGDAVVLVAVPDDDSRFIGWYQDEDLICTSRIYEVTAKENLELTALFVSISDTDSATVPVTELFTDVTEGSWYEKAVQYVYDKGLMEGNDDKFTPNGKMTRGMFVTTLYRLAGEPEITGYSACEKLKDVSEDAWYTDAVCWAYANGITTGYESDRTFRTNVALTREQLATFLYRYAQYQELDVGVTDDLSGLLNADKVKPYAEKEVKWAVGAGLVSGLESTDADGTTVYDLAPQGTATRAQMASILMRFCENYNI